MVVLVPSVVWFYYSNSSKYGENNVMYKTWAWINHAINEATTTAGMPEVLSGCAEYHELLMPPAEHMDRDKKAMVALEGGLRGFMQRPKYQHILVVKGNYLVHAHCTRTELPEFFQGQLEAVLRGSKNLMKAFVDQCQQRMWMGPAMEVIRFNQMITQGMWLKSTNSQLLQLPNFTKVQVKDAAKVMSGEDERDPFLQSWALSGLSALTQPLLFSPLGSESIEKFLSLDLDTKTSALSSLPPPQKADVILACDIIPRISVTISTFVEDDEDQKIYANDLITVRVKVDRLNLKEGENAGLVHAPRFPEPRKETWWVILATKDGKIVSIENVAKKEKVRMSEENYREGHSLGRRNLLTSQTPLPPHVVPRFSTTISSSWLPLRVPTT